MRPPIIGANQVEFSHTDFNLLMQRRICRILLVCSNYDFFLLEEDGRIDEQIFNEYTRLGIRFPPVFIKAESAKNGFEVLASDNIDLVILMLNIGDIEPFELAQQIKSKYKQIPIVVLTHFSREVSIRLKNEDLSAIDYVFCWIGNADLLLAIIKLIEDKMNAAHDIIQVGVQAILLVEDSVRYISQILPYLYKTVIQQSHNFMNEGLNEHQKMLRLRGRPKILLAKTFDEANGIYHKYGDHILGIISDINFKKNKHRETETQEGFELCKLVRSDDPNMPFLLQSSDNSNEKYAKELNAGFIHKLSKTLSIDLQKYISANFGFGELVFRDPETNEEIMRAADLADLQQIILKIPDNVLQFHASRNEISKWLNARALFTIGRLIKNFKIEDFENLEHVRKYIYDAIANYRISKGHGVIAIFNKENFNEYLVFSRIGDGSLGGKARGLAFIDTIIKKHNLAQQFENAIISIPRTVVISTDLFDEFIETNNLNEIAFSDIPDEEILKKFIAAQLPKRLIVDLRKFAECLSKPIAVRSSSKLEDSHYQPFAGIYSTYMIPFIEGNTNEMLKVISEAIKCVYASVFYKESKAYISATSNLIDEEKMGIVLQELCGQPYGNRFYPAISGVASSLNFYPIAPEKPEDGVANIAYGLGKYVVDGGMSIRFSPKYPKKILQLSNTKMALRETQKRFYALDLNSDSWHPSVDDKVNLLDLKIGEAQGDNALKYAVSTFDFENNRILDGIHEGGRSVVTFSNVLNHEVFPLSEILNTLLKIGQSEMNTPIEIEFAVNLDVKKGELPTFYFLQIRPIVENISNSKVEINQIDESQVVVYSKLAIGNGEFPNIYDFVFVKPESFNSSQTLEIAKDIEQINSMLKSEKRNYILCGPGRWGSADPFLGIPVKWSQISEARIIIESGLENYRIDPSQGSHFFQNLTSFKVGYMIVNPFINDGFYNVSILSNQQTIAETKYIKAVRFEKPLTVKIDGRKGIGIINY